jgi:hypothetical protein
LPVVRWNYKFAKPFPAASGSFLASRH